jgi:hypothetical protein
MGKENIHENADEVSLQTENDLVKKIMRRCEGNWRSDVVGNPKIAGSDWSPWAHAAAMETLLEIRDVLDRDGTERVDPHWQRYAFARLLRLSHRLDIRHAQIERYKWEGGRGVLDLLKKLAADETVLAQRLLELLKRLPEAVDGEYPDEVGKHTLSHLEGSYCLSVPFTDTGSGLAIPEGTRITKPFFAFLCRTYENLCAVRELLDGNGEEIRSVIGSFVKSTVKGVTEQKLEAQQQNPKGNQLDLHDELAAIRYLNMFSEDHSMAELLARVSLALRNDKLAMKVMPKLAATGDENAIAYLQGKGKSEVLDALSLMPKKSDNELWASRDALKASNCQYGWDDEEIYRQRAVLSSDAEEKSRNLQRASVARLLRHLVNEDLRYGQVQPLSGIRLSSLQTAATEDGPQRESASVMTLGEAYAPLKFVLDYHRNIFIKTLNERYKGRHFSIFGRLKGVDSLLLKQLKEEQPVSAGIVDLIGCTLLTDDRQEVLEVIADIRSLMDEGRFIKELRFWPDPKPLTGRLSIDLTGYLRGSDVMVQLQCRTKEIEHREAGKLANHEAYKVFWGIRLLDQVNRDPEKYLDLLYRAIHNLHMAARLCTPRPNPDRSAVIVSRYSKNYDDSVKTQIEGVPQ